MENKTFVFPRSPVDSLITEKALNIVNQTDYQPFIDKTCDENPEALPVKNVCAKVSSSLSDDIDGICSLLSISKRLFVQAALVEATAKAHRIIEEEGVNYFLETQFGAED